MEQKTKLNISTSFGALGAIIGYVCAYFNEVMCAVSGTKERVEFCASYDFSITYVGYSILGFVLFFIIAYLIVLLIEHIKRQHSNK